ncbi:hypothetical protein F442_19932 [Phytophthora nicotianae P10297]|uniref:Histone-lysine N-methyltransferase, H3 lysine-79 specific n=1 Tax=Phytophthora nicotianae P10297 TaxID=1317064 RepID=W2Y918_PHYNI|nr:hypothetical protein F442_19932 [Phytophthora nicotianae P10297]
MTTRFTFEDDKELVQLASAYAATGARISWEDVAQRMQRTGHNVRALQERLRTLKMTWGKDIQRFPPSFFTPVHRPRGRPPRVTRQLRVGAATTQHRQLGAGSSAQQQSSTGDGLVRSQRSGTSTAVPLSPQRQDADPRRHPTPQQQLIPTTTRQTPLSPAIHAPPTSQATPAFVAPSAVQASPVNQVLPIARGPPVIHAPPAIQVPSSTVTAATQGLSVFVVSSASAPALPAARVTNLQRPRDLATVHTVRPTSSGETSPDVAAILEPDNTEDTIRSLSGGSSSVSSPGVPDEDSLPPMSPSSSERAVVAIFADIPRAVVVQSTTNLPHRNAGELLPTGISTLLRELGGLDRSDSFLDIGSGVGNVVAQVALATSVNKVIGVEIRRDLYDLGMKMMAKSTRSRRLLERVQLVCQDIVDMHISTTPPYADVTVVFWNNILFEPQVVEIVKEELSGMFLLKKLVSSLNFCPRHRDICRNQFCRAFNLEKVLNLPCSWKADLQQIFVYESL